MIPNFRTYLNESVWGDLRKKSLGQEERMEDDVNSLGCADFCKYLKTKYEGYCDTDHIGRMDNYIKFHLAVGANLHIRYNDDGKTIKEIAVEPFGKNFFSGFEAELKSKNVKHNLSADFDGLDTFEIKGKNGNTSNRTVIEFIDNYFNYVIDEEGEKILMKLCDKLRPDYEKGEEITLDKILDLAKYELVVNRYSQKTRFFNFVEKNYDDIMDIIKNGTSVYESVWGDLRKKSLGQEERIESSIDQMSFNDFINYIESTYKSKDNTVDIEVTNSGSNPYMMLILFPIERKNSMIPNVTINYKTTGQGMGAFKVEEPSFVAVSKILFSWYPELDAILDREGYEVNTNEGKWSNTVDTKVGYPKNSDCIKILEIVLGVAKNPIIVKR